MKDTVKVRKDLTIIISEPVRDALGGVHHGDILEVDIITIKRRGVEASVPPIQSET